MINLHHNKRNLYLYCILLNTHHKLVLCCIVCSGEQKRAQRKGCGQWCLQWEGCLNTSRIYCSARDSTLDFLICTDSIKINRLGHNIHKNWTKFWRMIIHDIWFWNKFHPNLYASLWHPLTPKESEEIAKKTEVFFHQKTR